MDNKHNVFTKKSYSDWLYGLNVLILYSCIDERVLPFLQDLNSRIVSECTSCYNSVLLHVYGTFNKKMTVLSWTSLSWFPLLILHLNCSFQLILNHQNPDEVPIYLRRGVLKADTFEYNPLSRELSAHSSCSTVNSFFVQVEYHLRLSWRITPPTSQFFAHSSLGHSMSAVSLAVKVKLTPIVHPLVRSSVLVFQFSSGIHPWR